MIDPRLNNRYFGDPRYSGDRIVEVCWVRNVLSQYEYSDLADFGTVIRTLAGPTMGWPSFVIDEAVGVHGFDLEKFPETEGNYTSTNLMVPQQLPGGPFDVGVCISALEHFGLGKYCGVRQDNGDVAGLKNMWNNIYDNGIMLITVPCGRGIVLNEWIREYHPNDLKKLLSTIDNVAHLDIEYFFATQNDAGKYCKWWKVEEELLIELKAKEPKDFTITTGLACVKLHKGVS